MKNLLAHTKKTKKVFVLSIGILFFAKLAYSQCSVNYKEALKVCEGIYLKHYELNSQKNPNLNLVLNEGNSYLIYLLNTNKDLNNYSLVNLTEKQSPPLIVYNRTEKYICYIISPEETGAYKLKMKVDKETLACALVAVFIKSDIDNNNKDFSQKDCPSGTVKVGNNLFFDKTEVSNLAWREYLSWIVKKYGKKSDEYKEALPDTLVWKKDNMINTPLVEYYFRHPAFGSYPVVGISYEQAIAFCKWRSDRVNEYFYIKKNRKKTITEETECLIPNIYKYRLPTKQEWETYASVELSDKSIRKMKRRGLIRTGNFKSNEKEISFPSQLSDNAYITAPVISYFPNKLYLYNMFGNVAEMISEKGVAKGGSWMHIQKNSTVKKDFEYKKPTDWLGFRCICEQNN